MHTLHLAFHSVLKPGEPGYNHPLSCSVARLCYIIAYLKGSGFAVMSCRDFVAQKHIGKAATISFDDGHRDGYTTALPILKEFGVSATFFVIACTLEGKLPPNTKLGIALRELGVERVTELFRRNLRGTTYEDLLQESCVPTGPFIHDPPPLKRLKTLLNCSIPLALRQAIADEAFAEVLRRGGRSEDELCRAMYMSGDELRGLERAGMEVASHSVTHAMLQNRSPQEVEEEMGSSLTTLQSVLGHRPVDIAWPYDSDGILPVHLQGVVGKFPVTSWTIYLPGQLPSSTGEADTPLIRRVDHSLFEKVAGIE